MTADDFKNTDILIFRDKMAGKPFCTASTAQRANAMDGMSGQRTRYASVLSTRPNQLLSVIEGPFFDHWLKIVDIKEQKIGVLTPDFLQK